MQFGELSHVTLVYMTCFAILDKCNTPLTLTLIQQAKKSVEEWNLMLGLWSFLPA
jgi:hypothetical protein